MSWIIAGALVLGYLAAYYYMPRPHFPDQQWNLPTADDGIVFPVVFGTRRLERPNIVWYGDRRKNGEKFSLAVQYAICQGKLDNIQAVTVGGERAWHGILDEDGYVSCVRYFDGTEEYAKDDTFHTDYFLGFADLTMGEVDDTPGANSGQTTGWQGALAVKQGISGGAGPSYAGIAQAYFNGVEVGKTPYLKPVGFEVQRIHYADGGASAQWYDAVAEITVGWNREDDWKYLVVGSGDSTDRSGIAFDDSGWDVGPGGVGNAPAVPMWQAESGLKDGPEGYKMPATRTHISEGLGFTSGTWPNTHVDVGAQVWMRKDLGALPVAPLGVRCWHDDEGELWFNGNSITLTGIYDPNDEDTIKFNSHAVIPASMIDPDGPNVVAYKVTNTGTQSPFKTGFGRAAADSVKVAGNGQFIYAGIQIGPNVENPERVTGMNVITAIRECLTDTIWGAGIADALMGDTFDDAADTCYAEFLGISAEWRGAEGSGDFDSFVSELCRHANAVLYVDRATGLFEIKLIRQDYDVGTILALDEDTIETVEDAHRPAVGEMINAVTVSYTASLAGDRGTYNVFENGLITAQGGISTAKIDYPFLITQHNAALAAHRDLRVGSSPFLACRIPCSRHAASLNPGDPFLLSFANLDIDEVVMRVQEIDLGDGRSGKVTIQCAEDVFYRPEPETIAVPAGTGNPMVELGPLVAQQSKWYTTRVIDPLNRGSLACCFLGPHVALSNTPMFEGFNEVEPGVFERAIAGPVPDAWFDDFDQDIYNPDGSPLIGRTVLAYYQGDTSLNGLEEKYQGPYIVENPGWEWVLYGGVPFWESRNLRLRRHPDYDRSADFVEDMVFLTEQGTLYGGKYFTLDNASTSLGATDITWTLTDTKTWATEYHLLNEQQMLTEAAPADELDTEVTMASGQADFPEPFPMLEGSPGIDTIPPGWWEAHFEAVWLDADDPAATIALGVKIYRIGGTVAETVFEMLSSAIHNTDEQPLIVRGYYKGFALQHGQRLVFIPVLHTTSASPVTLNFRYNSRARGTYILAPFKAQEVRVELSQRTLNVAAFADGVITAPEGSTSVDVTMSPGDVVQGFDRPNSQNGDVVSFLIRGAQATEENRILIKHLGTVAGETKAFRMMSESNLGVAYEDLDLRADRARFRCEYNETDNCWYLMPGGVIA